MDNTPGFSSPHTLDKEIEVKVAVRHFEYFEHFITFLLFTQTLAALRKPIKRNLNISYIMFSFQVF